MAPTFELPFSLHYSDVSISSPSDGDDNFQDDLLSDFGGDDIKPYFSGYMPQTTAVIQPTATVGNPSTDEAATKRRSRRPPSTAAKRATHNAIERARRESLNGRFIELAKALPNMAAVKRPSKSAIVIKSLEFVYQSQNREKILADQNAALRRELESLRVRLHHQQSSQPTAFDTSAFGPQLHSPISSTDSVIARSPSAGSSTSSAALTPPPMELSAPITNSNGPEFFNPFYITPTVNEFATYTHPVATGLVGAFDWNSSFNVFNPTVHA